MADLKEKLLIIIGMALALLIVFTGGYLAWSHLVQKEAVVLGKDLFERLRKTVVQIDKEADNFLTPEIYQKFHRKPLAKMYLAEMPEIKALVERLAKIIHNPEGGLHFYTECPVSDKAQCYEDFLFGIENKTFREGYNPKSRPWYLATRFHTDWVVIYFMTSKQVISGYPTAWSIGFVKRILLNPSDEEDGIWFSVTTPNFTKSKEEGNFQTSPILDMLFSGERHTFRTFDVSLKTLRFPKEILYKHKPINIACDAITKFEGLSYAANVQCLANAEPIQFLFSKRYDHPFHLGILIAFGLCLLYGASLFLRHFANLERERLNREQAIGQQQKLQALIETAERFPRVEGSELLPLSQEAFTQFVKQTYGSLPQMASQRGLDLNNIYRVQRKYKNSPFIAFKYETIQEMVGILDSKVREERIRKMLCPKDLILKTTHP